MLYEPKHRIREEAGNEEEHNKKNKNKGQGLGTRTRTGGRRRNSKAIQSESITRPESNDINSRDHDARCVMYDV